MTDPKHKRFSMERDSDLVTITDDKCKFFQDSSHIILGDDKTTAKYIEESIQRLNELERKVQILKTLFTVADKIILNYPKENGEWIAARQKGKHDWDAI